MSMRAYLGPSAPAVHAFVFVHRPRRHALFYSPTTRLTAVYSWKVGGLTNFRNWTCLELFPWV